MVNQHQRLIQWFVLLCLVLLLLEPLTALAQTSLVRPPTRRPRNSGSVPNVPTPPPSVSSDGIGTISQGLGSCDASAVHSSGILENGDFAGGYYVLGLVAPIGDDILRSGDLISFWVTPGSDGWISMSATEVQTIADAGGDLDEVVLIGALEVGIDTFVWKAIGACANFFNRDLGGEAFIADLYMSYYDDPATSPRRAVEPSSGDLAPSEFNPSLFDNPDMIPFSILETQNVVATGLSEEGALGAGSWNNRLAGNEGDSYSFYVDANTIVSVAINSPIDTVAEIRDASGATIVQDDDSGGNLNPLLTYMLPYAGDYTLVVRPYSVGIEAPVIAPTYLQAGSYAESIDTADGDQFVFYGDAGANIVVRVTAEGSFDTVAEIYDSSGTFLVGNDDTNGLNPYLDYVLPYSGEYVLLIRPFSSDTRGAYTLEVSLGGVQSVGCPNLPPPQLFVGAMVVATPGNATRVRADHTTDAQILAQMRRDTTADVLAGPVCANERVWWQVNYNGIVGWSAEVDQDGEYLLMAR
jgi:hypothetical protein